MESDYKPRLRPMMIMRAQAEGKNYLVVQDPERVAETVMLSADVEPVLMMMDGRNSLLDIQVALTRQTGGQIVPIDDIKRLVEELDARLVLDSPRFHETVEIAEYFWNAFTLRKPFHAGQAYEKDPVKLKEMIDGFYESGEGPGKPGDKGGFVRGILAPHIDVKSGGPTFAWAYREIAQSPPADLYVLIGTAHQHSPGPFSLSMKDYMTPLGILPTDREFARKLLDKFSPDWLTRDAVHRTEHSNEFQAVFLMHALGEGSEAAALPVLASYGHPAGECPPPWEEDEINGFLDALQETVAGSGKKVTYIVGGDLAHIGPRYGDEAPVLPSDLEECAAKDREMLDYAAKGDSKGFYNYIANEGDRRNICGMPPLHAMLKLLEGSNGKLLRYDHWFDESTRSALTYASMVWRE